MLRHAAALLLALALSPRAAARELSSGSDLWLYTLDDYPDAVCNDGSPGGFYFVPWNISFPEKENLWVVYLEGGAWCYNNVSCYVRQQEQLYLTSSRIWYKHEKMGGIFDADPKRNPFAGANLVYVGYCSSDAWVGNAGTESNSWNWEFRGQRIVEAVFEYLAKGVAVTTTTVVHNSPRTHIDETNVTTYTLTAADKVLFSGCSAGSRGAMFTLDYVQAMLPPGSPPVVGFLDSPLWVDVQPLEDSIVPLEEQTQLVFAMINASARIPAACAAAYPGDEGWKCLYGQYRLPFVQTPYLMSASQFDKYQLPYNEGGNPPYFGANLSYADAFQTAVRSVVLDLPTASQPRSAVYSSACFKHCTSTLAWGSFWGVRVDGVSLKDYLGAWYFGGGAPTAANAGAASLPPSLGKQRIEACNGFGCGQCHAKVTPAAPPLPPAYTGSLVPGERQRFRMTRNRIAAFAALLAVLTATGSILSAVTRRVRARRPTPGGASLELPRMGEKSALLRPPPAAARK